MFFGTGCVQCFCMCWKQAASPWLTTRHWTNTTISHPACYICYNSNLHSTLFLVCRNFPHSSPSMPAAIQSRKQKICLVMWPGCFTWTLVLLWYATATAQQRWHGEQPMCTTEEQRYTWTETRVIQWAQKQEWNFWGEHFNFNPKGTGDNCSWALMKLNQVQ